MSEPNFNNPTPQFGTAEYVGLSANDHCQFCHQPTGSTYYRVNNALSCAGCAQKVGAELSKDTHTAYMRALLFGVGAAILGLILYATFTIATGLIIGYVSLAVGWMVGKAMMKGSGGVGGRRYQITAALLTYAAVSMAAVPIWIHYAREHKPAHKQQLNAHQPSANSQTSDEEFEQQEQKLNPPPTVMPSRAAILGKLALLGIASPFFEVWEGGPTLSWGIGILILIFGIQIAWKTTAGNPTQVYGPFQNSPTGQ